MYDNFTRHCKNLGAALLVGLAAAAAGSACGSRQADSAIDAATEASVPDGSVTPDGALPDGSVTPDAELPDGSEIPDDALPDGSETPDGAPDADVFIAPCSSADAGSPCELLDLGHTRSIVLVRVSGERILSVDRGGRWVLWDAADRSEIASGTTRIAGSAAVFMDLVGTTLAAASPGGVELRDAGDGHMRAFVTTDSERLGLAVDGSYLWAASATGLDVWSADGEEVLHWPGDYTSASVFGAPAELRIAGGPAGGDRIETVDLAGGHQVSSSFSGTFAAWFLDGERFITRISSTVWVYSKDAVQEELVSLDPAWGAGLAGSGDYFWQYSDMFGPGLRIYRVGGGATPAAEEDLPIGPEGSPMVWFSPGLVGVFRYGRGTFTLYRLGAEVTRTDESVPLAYPSAFAGDAARYVVGFSVGALYQRASSEVTQTGPLGYGSVLGIAGSSAGTLAAGTAVGLVLFDAAGPGRPLVRTLPPAGTVHLSDDGTVLAAQAPAYGNQYAPDRTLTIYQLPDASVIASWPNTHDEPGWIRQMTLAPDGTLLGLVVLNGGLGGYTREVTDLTGAASVFSDSGQFPVYFTPDATMFAVTTGTTLGSQTATQLYSGATLVGAIAGAAIGWVDNERILVGEYTLNPDISSCQANRLYDRQGTAQPDPQFPCLSSIDRVSPTRVLDRNTGRIYDLETGAVVWKTTLPVPGSCGTFPITPDPSCGLSTVAGPIVAYQSGHQLVAETH